MSEHTGFTPGPWCLSPTGRYVRYEGLHGPNVCDLEPFGGPESERAANAALIASAPDLAEQVADLRRQRDELARVLRAMMDTQDCTDDCWCAETETSEGPPCEACQARAALSRCTP